MDVARRFYNQALATAKRNIAQGILGPDRLELATLYHNLGGLEHSRGRFAHAEPFARRAVEILDGRVKYDEAEKLYKHALAAFRRIYGPCHYEIAVNLGNLAANKQAQGKHKAAANQRDVRAARRRRLPLHCQC